MTPNESAATSPFEASAFDMVRRMMACIEGAAEVHSNEEKVILRQMAKELNEQAIKLVGKETVQRYMTEIFVAVE